MQPVLLIHKNTRNQAPPLVSHSGDPTGLSLPPPLVFHPRTVRSDTPPSPSPLPPPLPVPTFPSVGSSYSDDAFLQQLDFRSSEGLVIGTPSGNSAISFYAPDDLPPPPLPSPFCSPRPFESIEDRSGAISSSPPPPPPPPLLFNPASLSRCLTMADLERLSRLHNGTVLRMQKVLRPTCTSANNLIPSTCSITGDKELAPQTPCEESDLLGHWTRCRSHPCTQSCLQGACRF